MPAPIVDFDPSDEPVLAAEAVVVPAVVDEHIVDAEEGIISACLQFPDVVERCADLTGQHFVDERRQTIFDCILGLRRRQTPVEAATVFETLRAERRLVRAGGDQYIFTLGGRTPTSAVADLHLETVRNQATLRALVDLSQRAIEGAKGANGDAADLIEDFRRRAANLTAPPSRAELLGRRFDSFKLQRPGDDSILIGNRYLSRGDGAIMASTSGMGKSSLITQAAIGWTLGRGIFGGLTPSRPLKVLMFQAEDSEGDIAEMKESMFLAMQLTPAEQAQVGERLIIVTDRIHRGLTFHAELKRQLAIHAPDIVVINPLLAFIGGDVNDSEEAGKFLREQLNGLNEPPRFAYVVIHHTAKPPKEAKDRKWSEVMYDMAGSADLTNWARAIISLRASETPGVFNLVLAKRGVRAGFTKTVEQGAGTRTEPVTTIGIRHSRDSAEIDGQQLRLIHWEPCAPVIAQPEDTNGGGRRRSVELSTIVHAFPVGADKAQGIREIHRAAKMIRASLGISTLDRIIDEAVEAGAVVKILTNPRQPKYYLEG